MNPDDPDDRLAAEWQALLGDGLLEPPPDFAARVMDRVHEEADVVPAPVAPDRSFAGVVETTVVLIGALAACWQTLAFAFGLWAATTAA